MRGAVREEKRRWIRESTPIFPGVGDRQSPKYVRFKCDTPALAAAQAQWSREGIIARPCRGAGPAVSGRVLECTHGKAPLEFDDDHAVSAAAAVVRMVAASRCMTRRTPQLTKHFLLSTNGFVSDKALQKVGQVLKRGGRCKTQ